MLTALTFFALTLAAGPEIPLQVTVQTLAGESYQGTVESLSADDLVLGTASGPLKLPLASVLSLAPVSPPAQSAVRPAAWIELVDGSLLLAQDYAVTGGKARAALIEGDEVKLPTTAIRSVRLKHHTEQLAEQWSQIVALEAAGDVVVIRKAEALDYLEGALADVTADAVQFRLDGNLKPVKRNRVEGLIYFHPARQDLPEAIGVLTDAAGTSVQFRTLSLADGRLTLTTPADVTVVRGWNQVVRLDFSQGKLAYLGDLKPEAREWRTQFGEPPTKNDERLQGPQVDHALYGSPLSLGGKIHSKGLFLPSRTRLVYPLGGKYRRFMALAGIDDAVREARGVVRLVIEGDGRALFDSQIASGEAPREIELDIQGVRRLTILVEDGDGDWAGDHLDLCEARVVK